MGGVLPGVKPHLKVYTLPGTGGETVMQGLDSLAVRLKEYKAAGAVFAKWRSPLEIGPGKPSDLAIEANMNDLARYALICQDEGLVPIVEPDVSLNTEENRRKYRQMLFETPGAPESLVAAILDPETLYQKSDTSGKLFPEALKDMGVLPGVKPHLKVYTLPGTNGETVMQGLDSLA